MAISDEAYEALEAIVGERNVCRDPAVLDGYAFEMLAELVRPGAEPLHAPPGGGRHAGVHRRGAGHRRSANKYKFKVKPLGTGWYHWAAPIQRR